MFCELSSRIILRIVKIKNGRAPLTLHIPVHILCALQRRFNNELKAGNHERSRRQDIQGELPGQGGFH
jgi:hypothetical protein